MPVKSPKSNGYATYQ